MRLFSAVGRHRALWGGGVRPLSHFVAGVASIPHPEKRHKGGAGGRGHRVQPECGGAQTCGQERTPSSCARISARWACSTAWVRGTKACLACCCCHLAQGPCSVAAGGWAEVGVDPALYSRLLARCVGRKRFGLKGCTTDDQLLQGMRGCLQQCAQQT